MSRTELVLTTQAAVMCALTAVKILPVANLEEYEVVWENNISRLRVHVDELIVVPFQGCGAFLIGKLPFGQPAGVGDQIPANEFPDLCPIALYK